MYSISFKSVRDYPCNDIDTFIKYISMLHLGTIHHVSKIQQDGCHIVVHYSWFNDDILRCELDHGISKSFIIGTGVNLVWFDMVKTVPSNIGIGIKSTILPLRNVSLCRII